MPKNEFEKSTDVLYDMDMMVLAKQQMEKK